MMTMPRLDRSSALHTNPTTARTTALDWERDGADWPNRAASRFVTVGAMRWHVQVMGSGPVLLLLHGTGASSHSWRDLAPRLARHFTVLAPDLPGHGFSAQPAAEASSSFKKTFLSSLTFPAPSVLSRSATRAAAPKAAANSGLSVPARRLFS